jgi:DNA gyrase subunit A
MFDPGDMDIEDLIDDEDLVVTLSARGYIKAVSADAFRLQGRGGRGVQGTNLRDEDVVTQVVHTSAHAELLFFTNKGKVYRLRAHQIPQLERTARGTAVVNLLQLDADETVQTIIDTGDYETIRYLVFATRLGQVKKTPFSEYGNIRQNGLIAVTLREGDELVRVLATSDGEDIVLVSNQGQAIRFSGSDVRPMGRAAAGVRGMKLRGDDYVVSCDIVRPGADLLVVTDQGYGKRTPVGHYPRKGRGTMGVRTVRLRDGRGGGVVAALMVDPADSLILMSTAGVLIRTSVAEIARQGRDATGVRIMAIPEGGAVAAVAPVPATGAADEVDPPPDGGSPPTN